MRLKGQHVVRSETTIYVLLIVASLGAMVTIHRGRHTHAGCADCCHDAREAHRSTTADSPPNEERVDDLTAHARHHGGQRVTDRHRDR